EQHRQTAESADEPGGEPLAVERGRDLFTQRSHVADGDCAIHPGNGAAHLVPGGGRLAGRAHLDFAIQRKLTRVLKERGEHDGSDLFFRVVELRVLQHADNFYVSWSGRAVDAEMAAERILVGKEVTNERF